MQNKLMKSHKILKFFHIALVIFWAILLVAGYFAIFYPQTSHTTKNSCFIKKVDYSYVLRDIYNSIITNL